jgi:hypothetical protein
MLNMKCPPFVAPGFAALQALLHCICLIVALLRHCIMATECPQLAEGKTAGDENPAVVQELPTGWQIFAYKVTAGDTP